MISNKNSTFAASAHPASLVSAFDGYRWQPLNLQAAKIYKLARLGIDVDSRHLSFRSVVEHDARRDLCALVLHAGLQLDEQTVRVFLFCWRVILPRFVLSGPPNGLERRNLHRPGRLR